MDFQTVKSLLFTFAPFLISYGFSHYRSLKAQARSSLPLRRPVPRRVQSALNLLLTAAVGSFIFGLPPFAAENIFKASSSRLQTPSEVLWRRVASIRPDQLLTSLDERLQDRLTTINVRLFYLKYGPEATADCHFCNTEDPMSYLVYSLPSLLLPHLVNIAVLGLATSRPLCGREGNRWRMQAVLAGFIFAFADVYAFHAYDQSKNARVLRAEDLTHFFWTMRLVRYVGIGVLDAVVAALLWATSTNRILVAPITASEKLHQISQQLQVVTGKIGAAAILKNATVRSNESRAISEEHWRAETDVTTEVMADEEVRRSINQAMSSSRLNLDKIEREARQYSEGLINSLNGETGVVSPR